MGNEIVTTLISVGGVVLSAIVSLVASMSLVNWRLNTLEKKVDEHNEWGERFREQTTDIALIKQDIQYIKDQFKKEANHD